MTAAEFTNVVRKGLGRAIQGVTPADRDELGDILLQACREDWRHDTWFCEGRAGYLLDVSESLGMFEEVRAQALTAPWEFGNTSNTKQRFYICGRLAEEGDAEAWDVICEVAKHFESWTVAGEMIEIGAKGISWLVENLLPNLPKDDAWMPGFWLEDLEETDYEVAPSDLHAIRTVAERYERWRKENPPTPPWRPNTFEEWLDDSREGNWKASNLMNIRQSLSDQDIDRLSVMMLETEDSKQARATATFFEKHTWPRTTGELIDLCTRNFDWPASRVLSKINEPAVREYGLSLAKAGDFRAAQVLETTALPEDALVFIENLEKFAVLDDDYLEFFCGDLRQLSKCFTVEDRIKILLWMYEVMPCSYCRIGVVKMLIEDGALPQTIRDEISDDCEVETRKLANAEASV